MPRSSTTTIAISSGESYYSLVCSWTRMPGIDCTMCDIPRPYNMVHYRDLGRPSEYLPTEQTCACYHFPLWGSLYLVEACVFWIIRECVDKQRQRD